MAISGHYFGRPFSGHVDATYPVDGHLVELHVNLTEPVWVGFAKLTAVCLWVNSACRMVSQDGKAELAAVTNVWL